MGEVEDRVVDPNFWKVVAGVSHHFPDAGSPVYYLPNLHRDATLAPGMLPPSGQDPLVPARISAVVVSCELRARGEDVYIRYTLSVPDPDDGAAQNLVEGVLPGLDEGVVTCNKRLSFTDLRKGEGCLVPKFMARALLPQFFQPPSDTKSSSHPVDFVGIQGNEMRLRHKLVFASLANQFAAKDGWDDLKQQHELRENDYIVLARVQNVLRFGMRRIQVGARVSVGDVDAAFQSAQQVGTVFTVDYYPGRGNDEYVVLRSPVDSSHNLLPGQKIRIRSEEDEIGKADWVAATISGPTIDSDHSSRLFSIRRPRKKIRTRVRPWHLRPPI